MLSEKGRYHPELLAKGLDYKEIKGVKHHLIDAEVVNRNSYTIHQK